MDRDFHKAVALLAEAHELLGCLADECPWCGAGSPYSDRIWCDDDCRGRSYKVEVDALMERARKRRTEEATDGTP